MDYRTLFEEENRAVSERLFLSFERLEKIKEEKNIPEKFQPFFQRTAEFLLMIKKLTQQIQAGYLAEASLEELKKHNRKLYEDILEENYACSYANPAYAVKELGEEYGRLLSFLYKELRGCIIYAYESRMEAIVIRNELFIEIYNCFEQDELPEAKEIHNILYWFVSDYSDVITEYRIREQLDTELTFAVDLIMNADLSDLRYLYRFGEYITENELAAAQFINGLPESEIQKMADVYTEGYRIGFVNAGKDLSLKEIVNIRYHLGFERVVRAAIQNFENMGLKPVIYRKSVDVISPRVGYEGADANKQYLYDHKDDRALFLDKAYVERRLCVLRNAYEKYKVQASLFAGPAVIEIFGERPFVPEAKKEVYKLNDRQQKLSVELAAASSSLVDEYIKGEERSFTIIAFPMPEIGEPFEEIFREIIRINTLDYTLYQKVQQTMINALDEGTYVWIRGRNGNCTDLKVQLHPLENPQKETIFENCVADVNIPVGEVFTSPVLAGTNGLLHVTQVYLNELEYKQLKLTFGDGMVQDYSCANFEREEENRQYIKENLLHHHEQLPMGEFAIGTNTTAYVAAQKYHLADKLPILIAEKMGPHFAIGDTCYSREEEVRVFNPDGKEIIARDNEISLKRRQDLSKAYFNCHTDITIPYDELGSITIVRKDGSHIPLIENGRFVLQGTEVLNEAFL
ncbi:MAG: aminopeptidase [Lachnospiraceae bacterium]|nr:aminopeptidase [Lachnospiraceae bacterium]